MKCEDCKYWAFDNHFGSCKRYPKVEIKNKNDFCGEFAQLTMLTLPVMTEEEIIGKKRGRPAKEKL